MKRYGQAYDLFWIFLGIGVCTQSIQLKLWGASGPESGFVPFIAGLLMGAGGLLLLILDGSKSSGKKTKEKFWENPNAWKRIVCVLAGFCAMAYFMPILGFLISSILVMVFLFQLTEPRKWTKVILVAIVCCFCFYFLFNLFQVKLPKGFLGL